MVTIYHSPLSRSVRVLWLAEEIGLAYRLETVEMFSAEMQRPEFLAVHPQGKVPAIDDDGFILWETSAIFDYLITKYSDGSLIPPRDTVSGAKAVQWMTFAEGALAVTMGEIAAHSAYLPDSRRIPALVDRGHEMAPQLIAIVEKALADQSYILGETFTAADIMLAFALNIARHLDFVNESTPNCLTYCQRLEQRPAYLRACQQ